MRAPQSFLNSRFPGADTPAASPLPLTTAAGEPSRSPDIDPDLQYDSQVPQGMREAYRANRMQSAGAVAKVITAQVRAEMIEDRQIKIAEFEQRCAKHAAKLDAVRVENPNSCMLDSYARWIAEDRTRIEALQAEIADLEGGAE